MYTVVKGLLICLVVSALGLAAPVPVPINEDQNNNDQNVNISVQSDNEQNVSDQEIDAIVVEEIPREGRAVSSQSYPYEIDYYISAPYYSSYPQYPQQQQQQPSYYPQQAPIYYYPSYSYVPANPPIPIAEPQPESYYNNQNQAEKKKKLRRKYRPASGPNDRIETSSQKYTIWDISRK